jgi:hypothetical protein
MVVEQAVRHVFRSWEDGAGAAHGDLAVGDGVVDG